MSEYIFVNGIYYENANSKWQLRDIINHEFLKIGYLFKDINLKKDASFVSLIQDINTLDFLPKNNDNFNPNKEMEIAK